jgi:ribosomal protein S6--L-glutamate ligase
MEVNASPGLEGIEAATGRDVAGSIIEFAERRLEKAPRSGSIEG